FRLAPEAEEKRAEEGEEYAGSVEEVVLARALHQEEVDFAVVGGVEPVEAEAETAGGVYRHDEGVGAREDFAVRCDAGGDVPHPVLLHDAEQIGEHAHFALFLGGDDVAERGEGARRDDISEKAPARRGVFPQAYELAAAALRALCLGAFVEGAEAVIDEV